VLAAELLEHWGEAGFEGHVRDMQREYGRRASIITQAAAEHLQGLATWDVPEAGMFLWLKLTVEGLADAGDTLDLLKEKKVVVVPGGFPVCVCV
jgi:DNA-binding transcriptional MocR family regulator